MHFAGHLVSECVAVAGQAAVQRHLSTCGILVAVVPVQATDPSEVRQRAGATVLKEEIVAPFQVHDRQVTRGLVDVLRGTGCIVLMVLDDARCEAFALGVQVDPESRKTGMSLCLHELLLKNTNSLSIGRLSMDCLVVTGFGIFVHSAVTSTC